MSDGESKKDNGKSCVSLCVWQKLKELLSVEVDVSWMKRIHQQGNTHKKKKKKASDLAPSHVGPWVSHRVHNDTMQYSCPTSWYDIMNPLGPD